MAVISGTRSPTSVRPKNHRSSRLNATGGRISAARVPWLAYHATATPKTTAAASTNRTPRANARAVATASSQPKASASGRAPSLTVRECATNGSASAAAPARTRPGRHIGSRPPRSLRASRLHVRVQAPQRAEDLVVVGVVRPKLDAVRLGDRERHLEDVDRVETEPLTVERRVGRDLLGFHVLEVQCHDDQARELELVGSKRARIGLGRACGNNALDLLHFVSSLVLFSRPFTQGPRLAPAATGSGPESGRLAIVAGRSGPIYHNPPGRLMLDLAQGMALFPARLRAGPSGDASPADRGQPCLQPRRSVLDDEVGEKRHLVAARAAGTRYERDPPRRHLRGKRPCDQRGAVQEAGLERHLGQERHAEPPFDHLHQGREPRGLEGGRLPPSP